MKILLPVDGSEYTKRMLDYVASHTELFGTAHDYEIFTVVPPIPNQATRFLDRATTDAYYREQAEHVLESAREFAQKQGWKFHASHAVGQPAESIAALAQSQKPDLVVMGTRGHSALGNVIMGSVANGVLARCSTPVLLIR